MALKVICCQVCVNIGHPDTKLVDLRECPEVASGIRQKWCSGLVKIFKSQEDPITIRPWNIILNKDGTVISVPEPPPSSSGEHEHQYVYPSRFRIPPCTISDLPRAEQVRRAENFAMGSMLYHIRSTKLPFATVETDEEIQSHILNAEHPSDLTTLPSWPIILCCWSLEFAQELQKRTSIKKGNNRFVNHIKAHPYLSAFQASGLLVSAAALGAPSLLGVAGFSALGPVAGSAAAAWQSSQGLVQAGTIFSWLQSAAMGGAAAGSIATAGIFGGGSAIGATIFGVLTDAKFTEKETEELLELYRQVLRRGPEWKENMIRFNAV